jgi:hypothetical protein
MDYLEHLGFIYNIKLFSSFHNVFANAFIECKNHMGVSKNKMPTKVNIPFS